MMIHYRGLLGISAGLTIFFSAIVHAQASGQVPSQTGGETPQQQSGMRALLADCRNVIAAGETAAQSLVDGGRATNRFVDARTAELGVQISRIAWAATERQKPSFDLPACRTVRNTIGSTILEVQALYRHPIMYQIKHAMECSAAGEPALQAVRSVTDYLKIDRPQNADVYEAKFSSHMREIAQKRGSLAKDGFTLDDCKKLAGMIDAARKDLQR
jgi:hypothetical protein